MTSRTTQPRTTRVVLPRDMSPRTPAGGPLPVVSVLTPTWNRAEFLERVWDGLNEQSYRNFEWIVCDDGSNDDTEATLKRLCLKSNFPVSVITADRRVGKARMDNEAIAGARGEFIIWNASDDVLLPQALEKLITPCDSVPFEERDSYVGVTALCLDVE